MATQGDNIPDLVAGTLRQKGAPKFTNLLTSLRRYEIFGEFMKRAKTIDGGYGFERRIAIDNNDTATMTGLFDVDSYSIGSHLVTLQVPWRHSKNNYTWEYKELAMNRGGGSPKVFVTDILQPREIDCVVGLAKLMEEQGFGVPVNSSDDLSVYGLRYWLPSSTAAAGFNGLNPPGFSSKGGIDASVKTRFANWTAAWTDVSRDDLVDKMVTGFRNIRWKSPFTTKDAVEGNYNNFKIWMRGSTFDKFERIAEGQNENLGKSIGPYNAGSSVWKTGMGDILFKRIPVCDVPNEDNQSDNSVWMIDLDAFFMIMLKQGIRRSKQLMIPGQHDSYVTWLDISWNLVLTNPRSCARFIYSAT